MCIWKKKAERESQPLLRVRPQHKKEIIEEKKLDRRRMTEKQEGKSPTTTWT